MSMLFVREPYIRKSDIQADRRTRRSACAPDFLVCDVISSDISYYVFCAQLKAVDQ